MTPSYAFMLSHHAAIVAELQLLLGELLITTNFTLRSNLSRNIWAGHGGLAMVSWPWWAGHGELNRHSFLRRHGQSITAVTSEYRRL